MRAPQRGEVWMVDLGLAAKVRPCLIVSVPAHEEDRSLATLLPHTTSARGSRFETPSRVSYLKPGVFDAQSIVTVPHAKLLRVLGRLPDDQLAEVEISMCCWLGLAQKGNAHEHGRD